MTQPTDSWTGRELLDAATPPAGPAAAPAVGRTPGQPPALRFAGFLGIAIAAIGGPLALVGLYVPEVIAEVASAAGLVTVIGGLAFAVPILVWLRYAREISGAGGLTAFVEQAVGRRVALVQAAVWTLSYGLYLMYTSVYVVYDVLPAVIPQVTGIQPVLEVALPCAVAAVVLAPRRVSIAVVGVLAAGQLVLVALLAGLTLSHNLPASSFTSTASVADTALTAGNVAVLYVCASLPLFFGGEVGRPSTVSRGIGLAYGVVAAAVVVTVFPLAANPAFTGAAIPGMAYASITAGPAAGVAIGLGVAASIVGVMIIEYLAVTRLVHAVTGRPVRVISYLVAIALVASGPISLIDPERFYRDLLRPSLVALWVAQLIVVVAYPRFAARKRRLRVDDVALAAGATAVLLFGLYSTITHQVAT